MVAMRTWGLALGAIVVTGSVYMLWTGDAPPIPQLGKENRRETDKWVQTVRERGQNGDWIAIRGYHPADHLVSMATLRPLSHAAILDLDNEEVIEAVAPHVRVVSLHEFLAHSHRFELIRPDVATPEAGRVAVEKARSKVGEPYDFLGTIGLPSDHRSYCSELCAWSWGIEVDRNGPHKVIHPSDMDDFGKVIHRSAVRRLALPWGIKPMQRLGDGV